MPNAELGTGVTGQTTCFSFVLLRRKRTSGVTSGPYPVVPASIIPQAAAFFNSFVGRIAESTAKGAEHNCLSTETAKRKE